MAAKKRLYTFYISVLPLMVCSGMVYSVLAIYISELGASKTEIGMIYMTGSAVGALISPMVGRVSDRIGRKPVMAMSMVGFIVAFAAYSLIESALYAFPIQALEGATWAAMGTVASAFIADLAPEKERGWAMGMYERTWFIGWIIGPMLGGYLADTIGFKATLIIGSALTFAGLVIFLLKVGESRVVLKAEDYASPGAAMSAAHSSHTKLPLTSTSRSARSPHVSQ